MKREFEVKDLPSNIDSNNIYTAYDYPESGVYLSNIVGYEGYYFVAKKSNMVHIVYKDYMEECAQISEGSLGDIKTAIDDILKVIAITQKPELIKEKL